MMKPIKIITIIISLIPLIFAASSCGGGGLLPDTPPVILQGDIDGYVYAAIGSEPVNRAAEAPPAGQMVLAGANVSATSGGISKTTTTNTDGYFKISSLPASNCTVTISKSGYATKNVNIAVTANNTTRVGGSSGTKLIPSLSGAICVTTNIAGIEVIIDDNKTGITIPLSLNYTFSEISVGDHEVSVDWTGYAPTATQTISVTEGDTTEVSFNLLPPDITPPVAEAGDDGMTFAITRYTYVYNYGDIRDYTPYANYYTLDGSGSHDSGGGDITYSWAQTSGASVQLSSATASKPTFIPAQEDTYVFSLIVRDAAGNMSNPDTVSVMAKKPTGKIAFTGTSDQRDRDVMKISFDGDGLVQVTDNSCYDGSPRWSPDGNKILFTTNQSDDDETYLLATMNEDGTGVNVMAFEGLSRDWSPDGDNIIYAGDYSGTKQIFTAESDGSNPIVLTTTTGYKGFAYYSPDGDKILFTIDVSYDGVELVTMSPDGSNYQQLTNENVTHFFINWTPDGRILYTTADCIGCAHSLYVMNSDGTGSQAWPVPSGVADVENPVMTTDGQFIFYTGEDDKIHVMYSDGSADISLGIGGYSIDYHPGP